MNEPSLGRSAGAAPGMDCHRRIPSVQFRAWSVRKAPCFECLRICKITPVSCNCRRSRLSWRLYSWPCCQRPVRCTFAVTLPSSTATRKSHVPPAVAGVMREPVTHRTPRRPTMRTSPIQASRDIRQTRHTAAGSVKRHSRSLLCTRRRTGFPEWTGFSLCLSFSCRPQNRQWCSPAPDVARPSDPGAEINR